MAYDGTNAFIAFKATVNKAKIWEMIKISFPPIQTKVLTRVVFDS